MEKYIVLDTETTGTNPSVHAIVQIAWRIFVDGEQKDEASIIMRPWPGAVISEQAMEINGVDINDPAAVDHMKGYSLFKEQLDQWVDKYNRRDKFHVFAYNARFDIEFVRSWFMRCGDKYMGSYFFFPPIDVMNSVAMWAFSTGKRSELKNMKLETVASFLGIEAKEGYHDAMFDVNITIEIMKRLGLVKGE